MVQEDTVTRTNSQGGKIQVKSILKKPQAPTNGINNADKPAKKSRSKSQSTADGDEGGVKIQTDKRRIPADDFVGFESSDDESGGATLSKDHTAELLKGFESSSEDEDVTAGKDASTRRDSRDDGVPLDKVPAAPTSAKSTKLKSGIAKSKQKDNDDDPPITLYIGRIPHGFYEHQMKAYFSQFGEVNRLRLARNRKTGAHKHYGFLEFESGEVGRIVQQTMDNYLLSGHLLKVKEVPQEKLNEWKSKGGDLWKGANKRFKVVPWRDIDRGRLKSASRDEWEKRVERERQKRSKKMKQLEKLGYDFEMPEVKGVESVPVKTQPPAPEGNIEAENEKTGGQSRAEAPVSNAVPTAEATTESIADTVADNDAVKTSDGAGEPKKLKKHKTSATVAA